MYLFNFLALIAITFGTLHCSKTTQTPYTDPPTQETTEQEEESEAFSLSIPAEQQKLSKYCSEERPEIPANPTPPHRFDRAFINEKLQGDGLTGWMHGSVPSYRQFVFTYRKEDPNDFMAFFKAEQFSLVATSQEIAQTLLTLKRHDKIRLFGGFLENQSPIGHIVVSRIEVLERYSQATDNSYAFDLTRLQGRTAFEVFGLVHATIDSEYGRALVVEHKDLLLPLAVPAVHNDAAAPLYRGDIVNISAKIAERTHGAPHFEVNADVKNAIQIIDPMLHCHGLETTVTGHLAKFNKSPAISVDVYAVRVVDANGISRNYTLFPDTEDQDLFTEIFMGLSEKSKIAWDAASEEAQVVRNFWEKSSVKVSVKGKINVVSTEQANAQVYIKDVNDLEITVEE
jgi:hypothetical protein